MATKITTPELFNLSSNNTAATQLPVFTKSARPTPTASTVTVDYLVVGGGGGGTGGVGNGNGTGGGGAGGLITTTTYNGTESAFTAVTATSYDLVVGSFGAGGTGSSLNNFIDANRGLNGNNSKFDSIEAIGGGGGGAIATNYPSGANGGSGGGGAPYSNSGGSGTTNQGNSGGAGSSSPGSVNRYRGGGGGGASQSGANGDTSGNGGDGISYTSGQNSITGSASSYAGGGGGGVYSIGVAAGTGGLGGGGNGAQNAGNGSSALANTGSGGGGAAGAANYNGGNGGSGVVILRYPTSSSLNIITTGSLVYTESTDGSDTVLQFTEGSGNFGFAANNIAVGEMIFNSTTEKVEYWDGFQWNMIKDEGIISPLSTTDPFGDGSQTALYKFAGNGSNENGTYTANVTASYVTGILGGGVSFGGSSSSLVTSMQPLSLGQSKTLWINFDSINFNADKQFYFAGGSTSSYNFWSLALYYQHSTGLFYLGQQIRNASNSYWYAGTGYTLNNVSKTDWNLIYASYSAGNFTYSINNSTIATNPKTISMNAISSMSTNHDLGRIYSNGTPYYTASGTKISSMRQFNRELVQSEIQQIYDQVY